MSSIIDYDTIIKENNIAELHNIPLHDESLCILAVTYDNREILTLLKNMGHSWLPVLCEKCIELDNMELLVWLIERGCPWNSVVYNWAQKNNKLDLLHIDTYGNESSEDDCTSESSYDETSESIDVETSDSDDDTTEDSTDDSE